MASTFLARWASDEVERKAVNSNWSPNLLSAPEALRRLTAPAVQGRPVAIDVRSEKEFRASQLPGCSNIPILKNDERHQVGLAYKQFGPEPAKKLGFDLVGPVRAERVAAWSKEVRSGAEMLFCWRGGLRSQIAADWLSESGVALPRVEGGYKAIRKLLLGALDEAPTHLGRVRVITGRTGSGKTDLLKRVRALAVPEISVLDLEALAHHRGSSFGRFLDGEQPSQTSFENAIAMEWIRALKTQVWIEDESAFIGALQVPGPVRNLIEGSALLELHTDEAERIARIFGEYVLGPIEGASVHSKEEVGDFLLSALIRIRSKLGGLKTDELCRDLKAAMDSKEWRVPATHSSWIGGLLRFYYDPLYDYSLKKLEKTRKIVFRGRADEIEAEILKGKRFE